MVGSLSTFTVSIEYHQRMMIHAMKPPIMMSRNPIKNHSSQAISITVPGNEIGDDFLDRCIGDYHHSRIDTEPRLSRAMMRCAHARSPCSVNAPL